MKEQTKVYLKNIVFSVVVVVRDKNEMKDKEISK